VWCQPPEHAVRHHCQIRLVRIAPPYLPHTALQRRYEGPCRHHQHSDRTKMHLVVSTSHESRGICVAENEHVWINLQRGISGSIKASCIHAYLAPSPLSRGSDTCHACNKWSNRPRAATESPRLARERWLIKRCHGDESCSQRGHGHQF
jgi:hypothetical protein